MDGRSYPLARKPLWPGSIRSGLWEPGNCCPLFPRMKMWGANEPDGFSASTMYSLLSESLSRVCSRPCEQCDTAWAVLALGSSWCNERLRQTAF